MDLNSFSYFSKPGSFFKVNEDFTRHDLGLSLFILMDGFGGSSRGDTASRLIAETVLNFYGKLSSDSESTQPFYFSSKYSLESNSLINAVLFANKLLFEQNLELPLGERAGCSGLFMLVTEQYLISLNIGSNRLYQVRKGRLNPLIFPDKIDLNDKSKLLMDFPMNGFGLDEKIDFDIKETAIQKDDLIIATTSGFDDLDIETIEEFSINDEENGTVDFDFKGLSSKSSKKENLSNQSGFFLDFT